MAPRPATLRRRLLRGAAGTASLAAAGATATLVGPRAARAGPDRPAEAAPPVLTLAAAWRGPNEADPHQVGLLEAAWDERRVRILRATRMPGRPHGLTRLGDGSLVVAARRPASWLLRLDPDGAIAARIDTAAEASPASVGGHVVASADGRLLFCTETDLADGRGRLAVRDAMTLARIDLIDSAGIEPHQLLRLDRHLLVANGGIVRRPDGRRDDRATMAPSLVRIDLAHGRVDARWTLADPRLSIRHLATDGRTVGVALQAEHERKSDRDAAPVLAVWDGERLTLPTASPAARGYAGDIAPGVAGGFVLSSQAAHNALSWLPQRPAALTPIAELQEACALAPWSASDGVGGVVIAAARGIARWHPRVAPAMLAWPQPMALDNHWLVV